MCHPTHLEQPRDKGLVEPSTTAGTIPLTTSSLGSEELLLLTINDILACIKVDLVGLDAAGLLDELVAEDEAQVDGDAEVSSDEVLVLLLAKVAADKDVVVLGESDEDAHGESTDGTPHAQGSDVGESLVGNALSLAGTAPVDVGDEDGDPGHETEDGGQVDKVAKDLGGGAGDVHEGEKAEQGGESKSVDGDTAPVSSLEDGGSLAVGSKTIEGSAGNVHVGVGGGEDEDEDTAVDDVRDDLVTGDNGSDDEGRGRGTGLGLGGKGKLLGVVGDDHADEEDADAVEEEDSVKGELDGAGNGLARVLGFGDGNTD